MDLRYLQYIVETANEKSISKAAQKLFISQPTLSIYISKLEKELGTPLFFRKQGELIPTEAGYLYIDTAREMLQMKSSLYSKIGTLISPNADILSIGIFQNIGSEMIKSIYPDFIKSYDKLRVDITDARFQTIEAHLIDGTINLGFVALFNTISDKLDYDLIKKEDFVLAVSKKKADLCDFNDEMSVSELKGQDFILAPTDTVRREIEDYVFSQNNMIPHVHSVIHNINTLMEIVEDGLAISLIPEGYADINRNINYYHISEKPFWNLVVAFKRGHTLSNYEQDFVDKAKKYYKTHNKYL